jgi:hypothetical protein
MIIIIAGSKDVEQFKRDVKKRFNISDLGRSRNIWESEHDWKPMLKKMQCYSNTKTCQRDD